MSQSSTSDGALRVYVSGFHDWPTSVSEACEFDPWRCAVNPSGRLMIGDWYAGTREPLALAGELPALLSERMETRDGRAIAWTFDTLPVVWGIGSRISARDFDVVIATGLGVYDRSDTLNLEQGAFNARAAKTDAAGNVPGEAGRFHRKIRAEGEGVLSEPAALRARLDALAGNIAGTGYTARSIEARATNAFICNETHYLLLDMLGTGARPFEAYFIHMPKPNSDQGYTDLAAAVANVIGNLVLRPASEP